MPCLLVRFYATSIPGQQPKRLKALSKLSPVFDVTSNGTDVDVQIESK
jgi:hypothetical protein